MRDTSSYERAKSTWPRMLVAIVFTIFFGYTPSGFSRVSGQTFGYPTKCDVASDIDDLLYVSEWFKNLRESERWNDTEECNWFRGFPTKTERRRVLQMMYFVETQMNGVPVANPFRPQIDNFSPPPVFLSRSGDEEQHGDNDEQGVTDQMPNDDLVTQPGPWFGIPRQFKQMFDKDLSMVEVLESQLASATSWWQQNGEAYEKRCGKQQASILSIPDGLVQPAAACFAYGFDIPQTIKLRISSGAYPGICRELKIDRALKCQLQPNDLVHKQDTTISQVSNESTKPSGKGANKESSPSQTQKANSTPPLQEWMKKFIGIVITAQQLVDTLVALILAIIGGIIAVKARARRLRMKPSGQHGSNADKS